MSTRGVHKWKHSVGSRLGRVYCTAHTSYAATTWAAVEREKKTKTRSTAFILQQYFKCAEHNIIGIYYYDHHGR